MPFDGSGGFSRLHNWVADATAGIKILASRHDAEDNNLAAGLSACLTKDGQSQPTSDINWNGKKVTNLATPTAPTDAATKGYVDAVATASAYVPPIGAGMEFWGPTPPPKWLLAHGQAISRATYSALFAIMGTAYGTGDGSTTFNVPDVRGRTIAGKDNMGGTSADRLTALTGGVNGDVLGAVGGAQSHVLTIVELAAHTHTVSGTITGTAYGSTYGGAGAHTHLFGESVLGGSVGGSGVRYAGVNSDATSSAGAHEHTALINNWGAAAVSGTAASIGSSAAHNNVQPTIVANYIIYAGV